jgi:Flp pilus assembly protein TadG
VIPRFIDQWRRLVGPGRGAGRCRGDKGAAIVEFAIVFPVFMVVTLGMLTGGVVLTHQLSVTQAAREAARYGATIAQEQCASTSNCSGMTWAQLVQPSAVDSAHTTAGSTAPCYVDNSADDGLRVQVSVTRPDQIQIMVSTIDIQLVSHATARYET